MISSNPKLDITGIVLAGGESRRMGRSKLFLPFGKSDLSGWIIEKISLITNHLLLVSNDDLFINRFKSRYPVIPDIYPGLGPVGGLYTGLTHAKTDWSFVTGCDTPFLDEKLIHYLFRQIRPDDQIIIPKSDDYYHPLSAFYHRSILNIIESEIHNKQYSLHQLISKIPIRGISLHELKENGISENSFFNINTPADYQKAVEIFNYRPSDH